MITKADIDHYFTHNEKVIRAVISKSKSKFDKDVIFTNCYLNCLKYTERMGDTNHILVFIKRYVYQLYFWYKSRPLDLSEEMILDAYQSSTVVESMGSFDDLDFLHGSEDGTSDEDERLIDKNNIYHIESLIETLTDSFIKTLNDYDKILFNNWRDNDITSRKGLLKFYNQNYKYGTILQQELQTILDNYKKYILNNYVLN